MQANTTGSSFVTAYNIAILRKPDQSRISDTPQQRKLRIAADGVSNFMNNSSGLPANYNCLIAPPILFNLIQNVSPTHPARSELLDLPHSSGLIFQVISFLPIDPPPVRELRPSPNPSNPRRRVSLVCRTFLLETWADAMGTGTYLAWAQDAKNIPKLKALDCIVFSGASIEKSIGDMLADSVLLCILFGEDSTEVGPATMFIPRDSPPADEWEYFKLSNHVTVAMKPREDLYNIFEPILIRILPIANRNLLPAGVEHNARQPTSIRRRRSSERHPRTLPAGGSMAVKMTKLCCRRVKILHEGKSTSDSCDVRHQIHTGIIVQPAQDFMVKPGDKQQLARFQDIIWLMIEKANTRATEYARIKKNMILTASPSKPFEYTPKGTPRRPVALRLYSSEIEALYRTEEVLITDRQFPDRV
ncbi:hypothetical protein C8J57DRAFT_1217479 [Mycena rebaudengoi]|nr:hypothetical protein C8J57DRAFT_1217479 [Mycena rebaudengoi]